MPKEPANDTDSDQVYCKLLNRYYGLTSEEKKYHVFCPVDGTQLVLANREGVHYGVEWYLKCYGCNLDVSMPTNNAKLKVAAEKHRADLQGKVNRLIAEAGDLAKILLAASQAKR